MNIKEYLKRAKNDLINRKQYLDVYFAIITSFILSILGIFGILNQTIILSALLVLLGLFAKAILDMHWHNENIMSAISNIKDPRSLASRVFHSGYNLFEIQQIIKSSNKISLWGYTLKTDIQFLAADIDKGAREGKNIRIILLKPSGTALKMAAVRKAGTKPFKENLAELEADLEHNLKTLKIIKKDNPNSNFDYKVFDYFAPYTMYVYDDNSPQGKLMVKLSEFHSENDDRTTYDLTKKDDKELFDLHIKQFDTAWDKSELWNETSKYKKR